MERVAVRLAQVRYAMTRRLSCRRACALLRVARSALGYAARRPGRDATLVAELQRLAAVHPRYGYRRMWALLRRRGLAVNAKRVHRLWRGTGLTLPRRRTRRKIRTGARVRPLADRPNAVWTYDLIHDACTDGTPFKCLTVVDEFTKECLAITVARSLPGDRVLPVLAQLVVRRGAPQYLRSDNGPEFIARRIQRWLAREGITTAYIDPGKPWQNGVGESFHSRFRDECLNQALELALPHSRRGRSTPCSTSRGAIIPARPTGTHGCRITLVRRTGAGQTGVPPVFRTSGYETYATGAGPPDLGPRGRRGKPSGG